MSSGQLTVKQLGERLKGVWSLIPAGLDGKPENWLLIRRREPEAAEPPLYAPMLATLYKELPRGEGWVFEVKFDGYRALAYIRDGECELVSRNGKGLTERFPEVVSRCWQQVTSLTEVSAGSAAAAAAHPR